MGIEWGLNPSNKQNKLLELRAKIKRAEDNENEQEVLILEAELRALEKGEVFSREDFISEQIIKEKNQEKLINRKHNILRNMQQIPSHRIWSHDGIAGIEDFRYSYEKTFYHLLDKLKVNDFQELVNKKSDQLHRKVKVLDLFGGAYFIGDLSKVSKITGVRLHDVDDELLQDPKNYQFDEYLRGIINSSNRNIITGNLYEGKTWKAIKEQNNTSINKGFDLIVCRPEGPFRNARRDTHSIKGVSDTGTSREEIFVSLLERTLNLLSNEEGMLFVQTPDLKTNPQIAQKFWEDYIKSKNTEGYKFIFDTNRKTPDESFVVIRNKI